MRDHLSRETAFVGQAAGVVAQDRFYCSYEIVISIQISYSYLRILFTAMFTDCYNYYKTTFSSYLFLSVTKDIIHNLHA